MKNLLGLASMLFLMSCGSGKQINDGEMNSIYKKWELSTLDGKQVASNQAIYIELTQDKKISGFAGCNRLTGSYSLENGTQLKFDKMGVTRMACSPDAMQVENDVLEMLNTVDNFTINDGKLMLNVGKRAPLAIFTEMSEDGIVNKYWKLKTLEGKSVTMVDNQEREQYMILRSDGSLSGFSGCNIFNGQYELMKGNRISFKSNMASTMKACPDVNIDESAYLKIFETADNYTINGDTLSLNVGKRAPLAVFESVVF